MTNNSFITQVFTNVRSLLEKGREDEKKKQLFDENEMTIQMQICMKLIPNVSIYDYRIIEIPFPIRQSYDSICLIVRDVEKRSRDYNECIEFYRNSMKENGYEGIDDLTIIPLTQLINEFGDFDRKRELANAYTLFLVDYRIMSGIGTFIGGRAYKKKRIPISVNLNGNEQNVFHFNKILKNTGTFISDKGLQISFPIGTSEMAIEKIEGNIKSVLMVLDGLVPGDWPNINQIHLKYQNLSIPIYLNKNLTKSNIDVPTEEKVLKKIENRKKTISGDLTTIHENKMVLVKHSGNVKVKRTKMNEKKKHVDNRYLKLPSYMKKNAGKVVKAHRNRYRNCKE
ncbi:hypothetical protein SNEBB_000362 [Seison nebaliae]|nr:hypothetical protein SNEBB_000362 [Seison nebaliae]